MPTEKPVRLVRPTQPFSEWLKLLYIRRETLWFFVWKDLKVQYNNPVLGIVWSIFQPLVYFGIVLLVMNVAGRGSSTSEMPFAVYLICGLAIWNFSTSAIMGAINSIQSNSGIISKSFFPRFYLILAPIIKSTFDLLIMVLISTSIALYFGLDIDIKALTFLPIHFLLAWLTTLGWAAIASCATIWNRHMRHAIPVVLYAMIFALPIFYSINEIENQSIQLIYQLNPIAGSMDFLRACFGAYTPQLMQFVFWLGQALFWAFLGILIFRKTEKSLADSV